MSKTKLKTEIEYAQELTVLHVQIKDLNISFSHSPCWSIFIWCHFAFHHPRYGKANGRMFYLTFQTFSSASHSSGHSLRLDQSRFKVCMLDGDACIQAIFRNLVLYWIFHANAIPNTLEFAIHRETISLFSQEFKLIQTKREDHNDFSVTNEQWKEKAPTAQIHKMLRVINIIPQKEVIDKNLLCNGLGRWKSVVGYVRLI